MARTCPATLAGQRKGGLSKARPAGHPVPRAGEEARGVAPVTTRPRLRGGREQGLGRRQPGGKADADEGRRGRPPFSVPPETRPKCGSTRGLPNQTRGRRDSRRPSENYGCCVCGRRRTPARPAFVWLGRGSEPGTELFAKRTPLPPWRRPGAGKATWRRRAGMGLRVPLRVRGGAPGCCACAVLVCGFLEPRAFTVRQSMSTITGLCARR